MYLTVDFECTNLAERSIIFGIFCGKQFPQNNFGDNTPQNFYRGIDQQQHCSRPCLKRIALNLFTSGSIECSLSSLYCTIIDTGFRFWNILGQYHSIIIIIVIRLFNLICSALSLFLWVLMSNSACSALDLLWILDLGLVSLFNSKV